MQREREWEKERGERERIRDRHRFRENKLELLSGRGESGVCVRVLQSTQCAFGTNMVQQQAINLT